MRLYHFLSAKYGLDDLEHSRLKIAQFRDLNDPFELAAADISDPLNRQILRGWKNDIQTKWGVMCFSRSWRNPVLWSHYADKHRGLCLGFDVADQFLLPIKYSKNRIKIDFVQLQKSGALNQNVMLRLLGTKFVDWKYEKEVRLCSELKEQDLKTGLFYCEFSDDLRLVEVIAGPLCELTEKEIRDTRSACSHSVKIIKSRLAFQKFNIVENKQGFKSLNAA